jgi:hypothetical protein
VVATDPAVRPPRWNFELQADESWESNPRFVEDGDGSFVSRGSLAFSRIWYASRGQLTLEGDASALRYASAPDLDRIDYGGTATGSYQLSQRVHTVIAQTYSVSNALEATALTSVGLLLPQVQAQTLQSRLAVDARVSELSSLVFEAQYERVEFDSDTLIDAGTLSGSGSFTRKLGEVRSVGLEYTLLHSDPDGPTGTETAQSVVAVWNDRLARRVFVSASAGAAALSSADQDTRSYTPVGGLSLDARWPRGNLGVGYQRTVNHAFGLGHDRVLDLVSLGFAKTLFRNVDVRVAGSYGWSRDPQDPAFRLDTLAATAGVHCPLTKGFALTAGGALGRRISAEGIAPIQSVSAHLGLAWERSWR